jgi:hypothetical protein
MTEDDRNTITGIVIAAKAETIEAMRGVQAEILKGIEALARGCHRSTPAAPKS